MNYRVIICLLWLELTKEIKNMLPESIVAIERIDSQEELRRLYGAADFFESYYIR